MPEIHEWFGKWGMSYMGIDIVWFQDEDFPVLQGQRVVFRMRDSPRESWVVSYFSLDKGSSRCKSFSNAAEARKWLLEGDGK